MQNRDEVRRRWRAWAAARSTTPPLHQRSASSTERPEAACGSERACREVLALPIYPNNRGPSEVRADELTKMLVTRRLKERRQFSPRFRQAARFGRTDKLLPAMGQSIQPLPDAADSSLVSKTLIN